MTVETFPVATPCGPLVFALQSANPHGYRRFQQPTTRAEVQRSSWWRSRPGWPAARLAPDQGPLGDCLDVHLVQAFDVEQRTQVSGHPGRNGRFPRYPTAGGVLVEPGFAAKVGLFPAQRLNGLRELVGGHGAGSFCLVKWCR